MLAQWVWTIALAAGLVISSAGISYSAPKPVTFDAIRTVDIGGTEIIAVTPDGQLLATTNGGEQEVRLYDISNLNDLDLVCDVDVSEFGEPTSVAIHPSGTYGVVAIKDDSNPGTALAFAIPTCAVLWDVEVGIGPDSVVISPNGKHAVIAIEDEEQEVDDPTDCPSENDSPGRVDILALKDSKTSEPTVTSVELDLDDVGDVGCPDDPQPEGIAIDQGGNVAYVTLQENNALATIDLKKASVISIVSMGTTSHLADIVDDGDDNANVNDNFTGRREPDGIAISQNGRWLFTADEGDTDNDEVFSGGRTMSVLSADSLKSSKVKKGETDPVVADTGALIEQTAIENDAFDSGRADNRGPEPEGVIAFTVQKNPTEFAAVTLERYNALIIFDVSDPASPSVAGFVKAGVGPEGVVYVPQRRLLITSNEIDGSITFICAELNGAGCS